MPVFAVIGLEKPDTVGDAIRSHYGANLHSVGSDVWFVQDHGSTKDICDKLGITDGRIGAKAVVVRCDAYSGWAPITTWQWLASHPGAVANG